MIPRLSPAAPVLVLAVACHASVLAQPVAERPPAQPSVEAQPVLFGGAVEQVADGYTFTEGPCWVQPVTDSGTPAGPGFFLFCDRSPRDGGVVYRWTTEGKPEAWRTPSGLAIGVATDARGRVYFAETQERRITRASVTPAGPGAVEVLASSFDAKRLNATNDLTVRSDGSVYFTDPTFFTPRAALELDYVGVYRISPEGVVALVDRFDGMPNGLCFSPDEKRLYVNDFNNNKVYVYDVAPDGGLSNRRLIADLTTLGIEGRGRADGIRCDELGNVYTTGPLGVIVFSPAGEKIGALVVPNASNLAFGGPDGRTMLITAGRAVFKVRTLHAGATPPKPRPANAPSGRPTAAP